MATVNASIDKVHFKTQIVSGNNRITSDEPVSGGGKGDGLTPQELLCAALAACTSITLRMYADKKQWALEKLDVEVTLERDEEKNISTISRKIHFSGSLSTEQKQGLLTIANKCPIHKTLSNQSVITTSEV